jgi:hypothetical protein
LEPTVYKGKNECQTILNINKSERTSDVRPGLVVRNRTIWEKIARAGGGYDWVIVGFERLVERTKKREITENVSVEADRASNVPVVMTVVSGQVSMKQGNMMGQGPMVGREEIMLAFPRMSSSADQVDGSVLLFEQNQDLAESDKSTRCISVKGIDDVARDIIKNKLSWMIDRVATRPTGVMTRERSATSSSSIQKKSHPTDASISTPISTISNPRQRATLHQVLSDKTSQLKPVATPTSKILKPSHTRPRPSIGAIKRILAHDLGVKVPTNREENH